MNFHLSRVLFTSPSHLVGLLLILLLSVNSKDIDENLSIDDETNSTDLRASKELEYSTVKPSFEQFKPETLDSSINSTLQQVLMNQNQSLQLQLLTYKQLLKSTKAEDVIELRRKAKEDEESWIISASTTHSYFTEFDFHQKRMLKITVIVVGIVVCATLISSLAVFLERRRKIKNQELINQMQTDTKQHLETISSHFQQRKVQLREFSIESDAESDDIVYEFYSKNLPDPNKNGDLEVENPNFAQHI